MHLGFLGEFWWAAITLAVVVLLLYVFIAGRGAQGGLAGRASLGWSRWQALSKKAGELQARIILTIFYFTVALPFGLALTYLADPLRLREQNRESGWHERQTRDLTLEDAKRQY